MRLGAQQTNFLEALRHHGAWWNHSTCRWKLKTPKKTQSIARSLVKRGLATVKEEEVNPDVKCNVYRVAPIRQKKIIQVGTYLMISSGYLEEYAVHGVFRVCKEIDTYSLLENWLELYPEQTPETIDNTGFWKWLCEKDFIIPIRNSVEWRITDNMIGKQWP